MSIKDRSGLEQVFSEAVATFGLVLTILLTLRAKPQAVATSVGLYITARLLVSRPRPRSPIRPSRSRAP
ncbi:MAG: hypothetical protein WDN31_14135 [Hyphomicrobium sp.]